MEWVLLIGVGIFSFVTGCYAGARIIHLANASELHGVRTRLHQDHLSYFRKVRQQIANELITRDPDQFLDLYSRVHEKLKALGKADAAHREARLRIIADTYPLITDFDPFQSRDYVLFADDAAMWSTADLSERYTDLLEYWAIYDSTDRNSWVSPTSDDELELLRAYVGQVHDSRFWIRVATAHREYSNFKSYIDRLHRCEGFSDAWYAATDEVFGRWTLYDTPEFSVHYAPDLAGTATGYAFKEDGLYGKTTFFSGDAEEFYVNIYRTDRRFEDDNPLDRLVIDHISVPFHYMPKEALGYKRL